VIALSRRHYAATSRERAANARLTRFAAAERRFEDAAVSFARGLELTYRDPQEARAAVENAIQGYGVSAVADILRDTPERFGQLRQVEMRRAFGLRREYRDEHARQAAVALATEARDWFNARQLRASGDVLESAQAEARMAAATRREVHQALKRHPPARNLEREAGVLMGQLLPRELDELRRLLTAPQLAIARKLREAVRDLALGREGRDP
jgi:hypothetical protein